MLAGVSPSGVAVPRHIHHWKSVAHAASLLRTFNLVADLRLVETAKSRSTSNRRTRTRAIPAAAPPFDCAVVNASSEAVSEDTITTPRRASKRRVKRAAHSSHSQHRSTCPLPLPGLL